MTHEFGDRNFIDNFYFVGSTIYFAVDTAIEVAKYNSDDRAFEVYVALVAAYVVRQSFTLPNQ